MKRLYFILLALFISCAVTGNNKVDSLLQAIDHEDSDTSKIMLLLEISNSLKYNDSDSALHYNKRAFELAESSESLKHLGNCYLNRGFIYSLRAEYKKAFDDYQDAIEQFEKAGNIKGKSSAYINIGIDMVYSGSYNEALEFFQKAYNNYEIMVKSKDRATLIDGKKGFASCYINIGITHFYRKDLDEATKYYNKALGVYQELTTMNDKELSIYGKTYMSSIYTNVAGIWVTQYEMAGNKDSARVLLNKALSYYELSLEIELEYNNLPGISEDYSNMAVVYRMLGKIDKAKELYKKSVKISRETGDFQSLALTLGNIAKLNITEKQFNEAVKYSLESLEIALDRGLMNTVKHQYQNLYEAYLGLGDHKNALNNFIKLTQVNDSLYNIAKDKEFREIEAVFQNEKKALEIEKLENEKALQEETIVRKDLEQKRKDTIMIGLIVGIAVVVLIVILLFRMFVQKKRANNTLTLKNEEISQKNEEITTQRDEIEQQRDLLKDKQEKITSSISYASRIQNALLPSTDILENETEDFFVFYKPRDIVSGDFYWANRVNDWFIVVAADCTGHGVPGAFMSMLGISYLNEIVRKKEIIKASDVLNQLRGYVVDALSQKASGQYESTVKDGMDLTLCAINTKTLLCQFAGANNNMYLVRKEDAYQLTEYKGSKMPIAIYEKMDNFTNLEIQLKKNDQIYLFSDGYADQFGGEKGRKFKYKPFKEILTSNAHLGMNEQKEILEKTFNDWKGATYTQIDDVMVLGIKI